MHLGQILLCACMLMFALLESILNIKSKKMKKEVLKEMNEDDTNLGISEAVPLSAPKKLSAKDVVHLLANDEVESPPVKKPKLDYERIKNFQIGVYIAVTESTASKV